MHTRRVKKKKKSSWKKLEMARFSFLIRVGSMAESMILKIIRNYNYINKN